MSEGDRERDAQTAGRDSQSVTSPSGRDGFNSLIVRRPHLDKKFDLGLVRFAHLRLVDGHLIERRGAREQATMKEKMLSTPPAHPPNPGYLRLGTRARRGSIFRPSFQRQERPKRSCFGFSFIDKSNFLDLSLTFRGTSGSELARVLVVPAAAAEALPVAVLRVVFPRGAAGCRSAAAVAAACCLPHTAQPLFHFRVPRAQGRGEKQHFFSRWWYSAGGGPSGL